MSVRRPVSVSALWEVLTAKLPIVDLGFLLAAVLSAFHPMLQAAPYVDPASGGGDAPEFFEPGASSPLLILVCAAWIVWNRRGALFAAEPSRPLTASALLLASAALLLWGQFIGAYDLSAPALSLGLLGTGAALGGQAGIRCLLFPAAFALLAFPLPGVLMNQILLPLQLATQKLSIFYLSLIGVEAQGNFDLIFSGGRIFQVIESCAGYRAMETLTMSAFLYSELFQLRTWIRVCLIVAAPVIAFFLNGIRVVTIVLIPVETSHTIQGLVAIAVGVLILAQLSRILQWVDNRPAVPAAPKNVDRFPIRRIRVMAAIWALIAALGLTLPEWDANAGSVFSLRGFPMRLDGWIGKARPMNKNFFGTAAPSGYLLADYTRGNEVIELYLGSDQLLDRRHSILSDKTLHTDAGSLEVFRDEAENTLGHPMTVAVARKARRRTYWLVNRWYQEVDSLGMEVLRSTLGLDRSPFRQRTGTAVVRIATPIAGSNPFDEEAREIAQARLDEFTPAVQRTLEVLRRRAQ